MPITTGATLCRKRTKNKHYRHSTFPISQISQIWKGLSHPSRPGLQSSTPMTVLCTTRRSSSAPVVQQRDKKLPPSETSNTSNHHTQPPRHLHLATNQFDSSPSSHHVIPSPNALYHATLPRPACTTETRRNATLATVVLFVCLGCIPFNEAQSWKPGLTLANFSNSQKEPGGHFQHFHDCARRGPFHRAALHRRHNHSLRRATVLPGFTKCQQTFSILENLETANKLTYRASKTYNLRYLYYL